MKLNQSPFKFLDHYDYQDRHLFFGRDNEIDDLYNALSGVKNLLVYGPSGSGKTSLIECGLRNQFSDADWFALTIRRNNNILSSLHDAIKSSLGENNNNDQSEVSKPSEHEIISLTSQLFDAKFQPLYYLFDQFEELLLLGSQSEKINFFYLLNDLIQKKIPCRVILIMREEFIGQLSEFEQICPSLFTNRFRLEKMTRTKLRDVVYKTLSSPFYKNDFSVSNPDELSQVVISKLPDRLEEIELTHLQVFMNEIWSRACAENKISLPHIKPELIKQDDNLESVLDSFLKNALFELSRSNNEGGALEVLSCLITERNTKLPLSIDQLTLALREKKVKLKSSLDVILKDLVSKRILRLLKISNEIHYEISHDLLANAVGENLTEEIKLREKALHLYKMYEEKPGLLNPDDINFLSPFLQYLPFPDNLKSKVDKSQKQINKEENREKLKERKRFWLLARLLIFSLFALAFATYFAYDSNRQSQIALDQKNKAEEAELKAKDALDKFLSEQSEKLMLQFNEYKKRAIIILNNDLCPKELILDMEEIAEQHPSSSELINIIKQLKNRKPQCFVE